jgi:hypothetical protein
MDYENVVFIATLCSQTYSIISCFQKKNIEAAGKIKKQTNETIKALDLQVFKKLA